MTLRFGLLVFPGIQQLDLTGPYEVFSAVPGAEVHLIGKSRDSVLSSSRLPLVPTVAFADCPSLDVLCVPGGGGVNALLRDETVLDFVRAQAKTVRYVTSVCTGALVLGKAGLLRGRRATTHWSALDLLTRCGATPVAERVVRDGNVITAGGVTAGIDFGLTVIAELLDRETAELIQLSLEYAPAPPFSAGTPAQAPASVLNKAKRLGAATRAEREALLAS